MDKKKKILKRSISVLLSLVICLSLMAPTFGEGSSSSSSSSSDTETAVSTEISSEGEMPTITLESESDPIGTEEKEEAPTDGNNDSGEGVMESEPEQIENPQTETGTENDAETTENETKNESESNQAESAETDGQEDVQDDTEGSSQEIFSVNYELFHDKGVYYIEPGATIGDMIALLPDEMEVTMTDGTDQTVPIVWEYNEEDMAIFEATTDFEEEPCIRFNARFPEEYTLASENGNAEGVLLSDLPQLNVCVTPYAQMYEMSIGIAPMISSSLNFTTVEQGNGSSCINGSGDLSSHRLFLVSGTGTVAFCAQHGAAAPVGSVTYTWNGETANSNIAAILDYTRGACYDGMTYNGVWLDAQYVRQAVQIAIYCYTNDWNYTSVSVGSIWATNMSGSTGQTVLSLCQYLVNSIAPQGSSTKYAIYRPSQSGYQIMIVPTEYEPGNGYVQVQKTTANPTVTNLDTNLYTLAGAIYGVYSDSACTNEVGRLTTGANGYSNTLSLNAGTYYVREIQAPEYYLLDRYTVRTVTVTAGNTATVSFSNYPVYGSVTIQKQSTDSSYTAALNGAVFGIYNSSGTLVQQLTTDSSGKASSAALACGSYTVRELQAPAGYQLNTSTYSFTISNKVAGSHTDKGITLAYEFNKYGVLYFEVRNASAYQRMSVAIWTDDDGATRHWVNMDRASNGTFYCRYEMSGNTGAGNVSMHVYTGSIGEAGGAFLIGVTANILQYTDHSGYTVNVPEEPAQGYLEIQKSSTRTDISNANGSYSLQGAQYGVYSNSACTNLVTTLTTNGSGYAKSGSLSAGTYWVKEISAPPGFLIDTTAHSVTVTSGQTAHLNVSDVPIRFTFQLTKSSANTGISNSGTGYSLSGAKYTLYRGTSWGSASSLGTYTTGSDGKFTTGELPVLMSGNYYFIRETTPSAGYVLNDTIYRIAVTAGSNVYNYTVWQSTNGGSSWSQVSNGKKSSGTSIPISNQEQPKYINIKMAKTSENTSLTDGNSCYSLAGAQYTVYYDQIDSNHVYGVYSTGSDGTFTVNNVPLRNNSYWYVKETQASSGYMLDETIWCIGMTDSAGTNNFTYTLSRSEDGGYSWTTVTGSTSVSSSTTISITSEEPPADDPVGITITKIDDPGEDNPLSEYWQDKSGAQFTVNFYAGQYDSVSDLPSNPTRSWVIETQAIESDGETLYRARLDNEHLVSGDDFYYNNGNITLPLGTITVEETKPAFGYTTEGGYVVDGGNDEVSSDGGIILLNITQNGISGGAGHIEAGNYFTKEEYHRDCSITLHKKDESGNALEGATFALQIQNPETGEWDDVEVGTSDTNGDVIFDELVFGTYKITETTTNSGYTLLKDPIIVELPYSSEDGYADADPTFSQDGYDYYCDISYTITNTPTFDIPMTGGSGISIFPVLGASILVAGVGMALVMFYRKRTNII